MKSSRRSSSVGERGGGGDGGEGSRGGIIPCLRRASLLEMFETVFQSPLDVSSQFGIFIGVYGHNES